jgi:hypothetical protein
MKTILACPYCGQEVKARSIDSYMSAASLGRPMGAKGKDVSWTEYTCPVHGKVEPIKKQVEEWTDSLDLDVLNAMAEPLGARVEKSGSVLEVFDLYRNFIGRLHEEDMADFKAAIQKVIDDFAEYGE